MERRGVLHINLAKSWRGGERQVVLLMEQLRKADIKQMLICKKNSSLANHCKQQGFLFKSFNTFQFFILGPIYIWYLHRKGEFSIIHCHESRGQTIAFLAKALYRSKIKVILHRRVLFPIKKKYFTQLKYHAKYIDCIICISKAVEEIVKSTTTNKKTVVIPSGINITNSIQGNIDIHQKYCIPKDHKIVVYIAALTFEKDHITFINAAKEIVLKDSNIHFLIIGDGPLNSELKAYVHKNELDQFITFTGFISNPEFIIEQTDVLLFTSLSEGLGSTILDYFARKRPVVSTKCGGAEELITDGITGFLCNKKDYLALSEKVIFLLQNQEEYIRISNNAYKLVIEEFSIEVIADRIIGVYEKLNASEKVISHSD